jgi:hypothetical protein
MTPSLDGHCHCGAVHVSFEPPRPPAEIPVRACQCGFCRRHGAATVSDPQGRLHLEAAPGALNRYQFGRRAVDALLCVECGVYVASVIEADGITLATLNIAGVALPGFEGRVPEPVDYDHETDEDRLARRKSRWTPAVLVESQPSA